MPFEPVALDHTFTAPIGVEVKGQTWACVEMPGSADFFGTKRAVRVDLSVDDVPLEDVGLMVTGRGSWARTSGIRSRCTSRDGSAEPSRPASATLSRRCASE